jgi:microcystin degradation protein MlrC
MRILIAEYRQEANSFTPVTSSLDFWSQNGILRGDEVPLAFRGRQCALAGMIEGVEAHGVHEVVFGTAMSCQSGGPADQEVLDLFLERLTGEIESAGALDVVLLSLHGAAQTTEVDDPEAEIVRRVRALVGPSCVIAASTDLHGYISRGLVEHLNILCGYHTYPHEDYVATGHRAATLALRAAAAELTPVMAWVPVPMIVSASAYNTRGGAFKELMDHGESLVADGTLLDFSIYQMQPWLDIPDGNSTAIAIAEDPEVAAHHAAEIGRRLYAARHSFATDLWSIDDVVELAEKPETPKPVILVDSADSCNAGAAGDSMAVGARIVERGSDVKAAVVVNDPAASRLAHEVGVGATATFTIGASRDTSGVSLTCEAYVRSLHDGTFTQEGPAGRGMVNRIGPTAVLSIGNLDVVVCEWMAGNGDPQLFRAFGVEPTLYDLVAVKANTSFRAAYTPFAGQICETDTPGSATAVLERLPFTRLPRTMYPWTDHDEVDLPVTLAPVAPR